MMTFTIHNIEKSYDRPVLKGISHTFVGGKLYVIKGVSGCGKSTLLNILGGIETSFSGEISLDGQAARGDDLRRESRYIYQQSLLLSGMTIRDNLLLIRNDPARVEALCHTLGIQELLDKQPNELSGGERQRVSVVRALLSEPRILLADEPTASLDDTSSERIAKLLSELRDENRIIIVATHERCFDGLADEILDLQYGEIKRVQRFEHPNGHPQNTCEPLATQERKPVGAMGYNLKRGKQHLNFSALLPLAFVFLMLFLVSTVQNCFSDEYFSFVKDRYPIEAFNLYRYRYEAAPDSVYKNHIRIYEEYRIEENGVTAYYLAEKQDSVLAIDGMLEYGRFPETDEEVIISAEYAKKLVDGGEPVSELVGREILFAGRTFTVSGVLYSIEYDDREKADTRNPDFYNHLLSDTYYFYPDLVQGMVLFIPFASIQALGDPIADTEIMRCAYRGIYEDRDAYNAVKEIVIGADTPPGSSYRENFSLNNFESMIQDIQGAVDVVTWILYGVFLVCFVIACIFIRSQVEIELFYRKKELGFLQIFGVEKRRLKRLVLVGYLLKIGFALGLAVVAYIVCVLVYGFLTGHMVLFNVIHITVVVTVILAFYILSVAMSIGRFLRRSILELVMN
jgi:ABC-type lipoprotein export system ATPase subunit